MAKKRRGRGEGSIEELKSGKFRAVVSAGADPVTGRRIKVQETFDSKKEAMEWRAARLGERRAGTLATAGQMTVSEWLAKWLAMRKSDTADATYLQYESQVRLHLAPALGATRLADLRPMAISDAFAKMEAAGTSASMRFRLSTTIRTALKAAVDVGLIPSNAALKIKKPKVEKPTVDAWDAADVRKFVGSLPDRDLGGRALFLLALDSGMRQGELLGLHWSEVDLEAGAVRVVRSLQEAGGMKLKDVKRDSSRRRILVTPQTVAALTAYRAGLESRGLVFAGRAGGFLSKTGVGNRFRRRVRAAGVRRIRFHDLRHTMATMLLLAGVNVKAVSARLGHASIQITLDTYAHVLPQMEEQAVNALTSLFG